MAYQEVVKNLILTTSGGRILQNSVKYINDSGGGILLEASCESASVSFTLRGLGMFFRFVLQSPLYNSVRYVES